MTVTIAVERRFELDDKRRWFSASSATPTTAGTSPVAGPDGTIVFTLIVAVHRDVARAAGRPDCVATMNDDSRVAVTAEEFPEPPMSPEDFEQWAEQHTRDAAAKTEKDKP